MHWPASSQSSAVSPPIDEVPGDAHVCVAQACLVGPLRAHRFRLAGCEAAFHDDVARTPAARQIVLRRRRAGRRSPVRVRDDFLPGPVLLRVAVPGIDLDQREFLGMLALRERLVPGRAGWRIETPTRAVRNDQRIEALLVEATHEVARRRGLFEAVGRQFVGRLLRIAGRHLLDVLDETIEVVVGRAFRHVL